MAEAKTVSLASLNLRAASDEPYEFEFEGPDGSGTGVFLQVLGDHSERVTAAVHEAINARRKKEAIAAAKAAKARPDSATFEPVESDVTFGQRLAAARLVGWRGIAEPWSPENALLLCQTNPEAAKQILAASSDLANFTKSSPAA